MNRRLLIGPALAAFLTVSMLLVPGAAFSQTGDQLSNPIAGKEYHGTPYTSGGIGVGERAALQKEASKYNLKLVYAVKQGNYLALVDTVIKNARGETVLKATAQGPWLFAKLPPGQYTITATTLEGKTQAQPVEIPQHGQREIIFTWVRPHVHE